MASARITPTLLLVLFYCGSISTEKIRLGRRETGENSYFSKILEMINNIAKDVEEVATNIGTDGKQVIAFY